MCSPFDRPALSRLALLAAAAVSCVSAVALRYAHAECQLRQFGGRPVDNYGAWTLCVDLLPEYPLVWSFGVGGDVSFEVDMAQQRPHASIASFDPTITNETFARVCAVQRRTAYCPATFSQVGLAAHDGSMQLYKSLDPRISSLASVAGRGYDPRPHAEAFVRTLRSLMKARGVQRIDVLKIDIEGAEFEVVDGWQELPVAQLAIELHDRFFVDGAQRRVKLKRKLVALGFRQAHATTDELLFIKA